MPHDDWLFRIEDMLAASASILEFAEGKSYEQFRASPILMKAILPDFAVLGEAAANVPPDVTTRHPQIPWRQMRAMRNVVVHEYGSVRTITIWETIQADLPSRPPKLRAILEAEDHG